MNDQPLRADRFAYLSGLGWSPLVGLGLLHGAAGATVATMLLSRSALRVDLGLGIAELDRLLAVPFLALFVAAVAGSVIGDGFVARNLLRFVGLVGGGVGLVIAGVNDRDALRALLVVATVTAALPLAIGRAAAVDLYGRRGGWRVVAACWSGAALGVGSAGLHDLVAPIPNWGYTLGGAGIAAIVGAVLTGQGETRLAALGEKAQARHEGGPRGATLPIAPIALVAVAAGVSLVAAFPTGWDHLGDRWTLTDAGSAGIVALAGLGAAGVIAVGHWYHRLAERGVVHLAGASGAGAAIAGLLVASGGASKYFVGIVVCWAVAGVAAVFAAVAGETAVLCSAPPSWRFRSGASLVAAGAAGAMAIAAGPSIGDSIGRAWTLALAALPLVVFGLIVARTHAEEVPPGLASGRATHDAEVAADEVDAAPASVVATSGQGFPSRAGAGGILLDCRNLDAGYDGVQVLFDVSLQVREHQIVALMGTNGAGKTTLLRTIAGLLGADRGSITFAGVDVTGFSPTWRVELGMSQIAGGSAVAEGLTVVENLRLFGHSIGRDRRRLDAGIDAAFDLFPRLAERRTQAASTLSGGEKQMLALSKAVILRPRLLVIDEFSLGLAPIVVGELLPVVKQLNAEGAAILLVEQSVNIALSIADHACVMEKGEIVFDGPAGALRDDPDLIRAVYLEGLTKALAR